MKLHTYLNYGGNCEEAFRFYEKNLGGKITMMMRYADQRIRRMLRRARRSSSCMQIWRSATRS